MTETIFLQKVLRNPADPTIYPMLADWLEDHDDPLRAELLRIRCRMLETCCQPDQYPERGQWQLRMVQLLAQGVRPSVPRKVLDLGDGVTMDFHFVSPGSFLMGSPEEEMDRSDIELLHPVKLTRGFYMGIHPVTQQQWLRVMGNNPSHSGYEPDFPVDNVSRDDSLEFVRKLGQYESQPFRLPTEAEWEYACRCGTTTSYFPGDSLSPKLANFDGLFSENATKVGKFMPNAWGLYDLHGNILEWCNDWYDDYSIQQPFAVDPQGPESGEGGVLRGGSWFNSSLHCRSSFRFWSMPDNHFSFYGLRVCFFPGD